MLNEQILENKYEILQVLRNSGMGTIYLGIDTRCGTKVAVKELSSTDFDSSGTKIFRDAFAGQFGLCAVASHHETFKAMDFFRASKKDYLVMKFAGGSLDKIIRRRNRHFGLNLILERFGQMLDVVEHLHASAQPVFHRDLKPSDFTLTADGKIKLLDFGIAEATRNSSNFTADENSRATTFEYAPLEQLIKVFSHVKNSLLSLNESKALELLNTKTSASTDVFALGATLYQLLTNSLPPDAHARALAVWSGKLDPILPLSSYDRNIPAVIESAVLQSLALNPADRPCSVKEFRGLLIGNFSVASLPTPTLREVSLTLKSDESKQRISLKQTSRTFFQIYQKIFKKILSGEKKSENSENLLFNFSEVRAV